MGAPYPSAAVEAIVAWLAWAAAWVAAWVVAWAAFIILCCCRTSKTRNLDTITISDMLTVEVWLKLTLEQTRLAECIWDS